MRSSYLYIIIALFLAEISATFESAMLYAALPTLIREFGDPITAGWLVTIHMLIGAAAALVAGRLGDMYGRKSVMLLLLLISAVGSIMSAVTDNFGIVLAGRALQGLSVAVLPLTIGILREALPAQRVPVAIGLMTTAQGMGVAIGLVLGGAIVDNLNWHWLFVASAVLLAASWVAVKFWIPEKPGVPPTEKIDWLEGVLPVPAIMAILLGLSFSKANGWLDATVWGLIGGGVIVMVIWARRALAAKEPFINLRLLATRNVALANVMQVLLALGTMQIVFLFSTYTQAPAWTMAGLGFTATVAGLAKLPSNILSFFAGPLAGWLTQKFEFRVPLMAGGLLACAGWLLSLPLPDTLMQVIILLCIISFGTSALNAAMPMVIVASVPQDRTSEAIGAMSVIRGMASAIGAQLIAVSLASDTILSPDGAAEFPSAAGYRFTMAWIAALTLIAALSALLMRSRNSGPGSREPQSAQAVGEAA